MYHFSQSPPSLTSKPRDSILFLHGFLGSGQDWSCMIEALRDDYSCVTCDLPGHGCTPVAPFLGHSFDKIVKRLASEIQRLVIPGRLYVVGYSLGARVALALLLLHPTLCAGAVLLGGDPGIASLTLRRQRLQRDQQLLANVSSIAEYEAFLSQWYAKDLFGKLQQHTAYESMLRRRLQGWPATQLTQAAGLMSVGAQPNLWSQISSLQVPIKYVVGALDKKYMSIAQRLAHLTAAVKVHEVLDCGHALHVERPACVTDMIRHAVR